MGEQQINDGGPAFPTLRTTQAQPDGNPTYYSQGGGMSLRDWFAAKAMQAEIITSTSDATPESAQALVDAAAKAGRSPQRHLAANAYEWADAMLAERTKQAEQDVSPAEREG